MHMIAHNPLLHEELILESIHMCDIEQTDMCIVHL